MNKNPKALNYSKRNIQQIGAQAEANNQNMSQIQQMLQGLMYQNYQTANTIQDLNRQMKANTFRSQAAGKMLQKLGITESEIEATVDTLIIAEFDKNSNDDDAEKKLSIVSSGTATIGMNAILSLRLFKDGAELIEQRILRSKIEIGKSELLPQVDEVLVGMSVGEAKKFLIDLQGKTDEAEVTLLGLRSQPAAEATKSVTSNA